LTEGSISAPGSFRFSVRNNDNLEPFKAPLRYQNDERAIRIESVKGPIFGAGHDLEIGDDAGSNTNSLADFGSSYQRTIPACGELSLQTVRN
jgi:hypothetical protein